MSTLTQGQIDSIEQMIAGKHICTGLGTKEEACSIAYIQLALAGELTDSIPDCMSEVIGRWIIPIQDSMPDELRNSARWRTLLPLAAGTGRDHEAERFEILRDWLWTVVMPYLQPDADELGFGDQWRTMCESRDPAKAAEAAEAAEAAWAAEAAKAAEAAEAAWTAKAAKAVKAAKAAWTAWTAWTAKAAKAAEAAAWEHFDPCGVLERLIAVTEKVPVRS